MSGYFCSLPSCGKEISQSVLEKRHYSPATMPPRLYCSKEHMARHRQQTGEFKQMSVKGKQERSQAVAESNHLAPRRKKQLKGYE